MNKKGHKTSFTFSFDTIIEKLEEQLNTSEKTSTIPANTFINNACETELQKLQANTLLIGFGSDGLPIVNFIENNIPTNTTIISMDYDEEQLKEKGSTHKLLLKYIPSRKLIRQGKISSNQNLLEKVLENISPKLIIFIGDLVSPEIHHTLNVITNYSGTKEIPAIGFFFTPIDFELKYKQELYIQTKQLVTTCFSGYYFIDKEILFEYIDATHSMANIMGHVTKTLSSIIHLTIQSAQQIFDKEQNINYQNNSILIRTAPDPVNMVDAFYEIKKLVNKNYKVNTIGILVEQIKLMNFFKDEFKKIIPNVDLQMKFHQETCIAFVVFGQYID